jgi:hypothetical protein
MNTPPVIPVHPPAVADRVRLDPQGRIDEDLPCRKCGYNLRTLLPEGRCPECATAVGRSLRGDHLRFADPNWVESLASGMNWIVASIVVGFLMGGVTGGTAMCLRWAPSPGAAWLMLPGLVIGLIGVIGYWKVTVPDPSGLGEEGGLNARKLLRFCQIGAYAINPLFQLLAIVVPIAVWIGVGSLVGGLFGVIGTFAGFAYARLLAQRIPDDKLARSCRIVMWGMASLLLASATFAAVGVFVFSPRMKALPAPAATSMATTTASYGFVNVYSTTATPASAPASPGATMRGAPPVGAPPPPPAPRPVPGMMAYGLIGCLVGPFALVFGIWSIVIIVRLRRALNDAARQARASWASVQMASVS